MTTAIGSYGSSSSSGLDPAQLKEMREKLFAKLDKNGDGTIDQAELAQAKQASEAKGHGHHRHGKEQDLLQTADADGDGKITKDELMSAFDKMDQQMKATLIDAQGANSGFDPAKLQQKREQLFEKLDANGDGTIDQSEIAAAEKARVSKPGHGKGLEKLLEAADADGDGKVSKDELMSAFAKIDEKLHASNGNGQDGVPPPPVGQSANDGGSGFGAQIQAFLAGLLQSGKSTV